MCVSGLPRAANTARSGWDSNPWPPVAITTRLPSHAHYIRVVLKIQDKKARDRPTTNMTIADARKCRAFWKEFFELDNLLSFPIPRMLSMWSWKWSFWRQLPLQKSIKKSTFCVELCVKKPLSGVMLMMWCDVMWWQKRLAVRETWRCRARRINHISITCRRWRRRWRQRWRQNRCAKPQPEQWRWAHSGRREGHNRRLLGRLHPAPGLLPRGRACPLQRQRDLPDAGRFHRRPGTAPCVSAWHLDPSAVEAIHGVENVRPVERRHAGQISRRRPARWCRWRT